ncbi:DoxX family protein [Candidatus Woesearchaeota archaeon]|nr:DoxX family protein [Candidatus Woesearchaeota archaeon]
MYKQNIKDYAPITLRISISLMFLWFGINQVLDAKNFMGYLPEFILSTNNPEIYVIINGLIEILLGAALIIGIFTRPVSILLSAHLLIISISLGYNDIMIRDMGLTLATIAIFLYGPDKWSLDTYKNKWRQKT